MAKHFNGEIVGRQNELNFLSRQINEARTGQFRFVLLEGAAGAGKTALIRSMGAQTRNLGFLVAKSVTFDQPCPPLYAWSEIIRSLRHQSPDSDAIVAFHRILNQDDAPLPDPDRGGELSASFFADIANCFRALAAQHPTVLVIDGLQWLDKLSIDLLTFLVHAFGNASEYQHMPILLIAAVRDDDLSPHLSNQITAMNREIWASHLVLGSLDQNATQRLIESHGLQNPSRQMSRQICDVGLGNPQRIHAMLDRLKRIGAIVEQNGYALLRDPAVLVTEPPSRSNLVTGDLHGHTLLTLRIAALMGHAFDHETLAQIVGLRPDEIRSILSDFPGIIMPSHDRFEFVTTSIRGGIIDGIPADERRKLHLEIATATERATNQPSLGEKWQILQQLLWAGPVAPREQVYETAQQVGELASRLCAWEAAAAAFEAASTVVTDSALKAKMHMNAGTCYRYCWDTGPAVWHFELAHDEWKAAGQQRRAAEALVQRARLMMRAIAPGHETNRSPFERALEEMGDEHQELKAYTLTRLCDAHQHGHDATRAIAAGKLARDLAIKLEDDKLVNDACTFLGLALQLAGRLDEAVENYRKAISCADALARAWLENIPRQRLTMALTLKGDLDDAKAAARDGLNVANTTNYPGEACMAHASLAMLAMISGNLADVEGHAEDMQRLFAQSRYSIAAYCGLRALAAARCAVGDITGALEAIAPLVEPGRVFERPERRMHDLFNLMRHYIQRQAEPERPVTGIDRAETQEAVGIYVERHLRGPNTSYAISEACMIAEMVEDMRLTNLYPELRTRLEWALDQGMRVTNGWPFLIRRVFAGLCRASGKDDIAEREMRRAVSEARDMGASLEQARATFELSRILAAKGDLNSLAEAQGLVRDSIVAFRDLAASAPLRQAMAFAEFLGLRPPREVHLAELGALSERRSRILGHLARGRTTEEISEDMNLSERTIGEETKELATNIGLSPEGDDTPLKLTLLVTDIERSTPLLERLGDRAAHMVLSEHDTIVRRAVVAHGGVEIKNRGDGILSGFHSVAEAVACAYRIQTDLATRNSSAETPIQIRIGLHSGDLLLREDGLFGLNIHIAVRICDYCEPGQIIASDSVWDFAQNAGIDFANLGQVDLKGLSSPIRLYALRVRPESNVIGSAPDRTGPQNGSEINGYVGTMDIGTATNPQDGRGVEHSDEGRTD